MKHLGTVGIHDGFVSESKSWCSLFPPLCYCCCIKKESAHNKLSLLLLCTYINLFLQGVLVTLLAYMNQTLCDPCEVKNSPNP